MSELIILDGGTGQLLVDFGNNRSANDHPMWATGVLESCPEAVQRIHEKYASVGAQILFSNTYSLFCISEDEATSKQVIRKILRLSHKVLSDVTLNYNCKYAVSIGPLAVKFHDCSEYTGKYLTDGHATIQDVKNHYRWILDEVSLLGNTLVACETIPKLKEVEALVNVLHEYPHIKAMVMMSANTALESAGGDSLTDAAKVVSTSPQVIAFGINCCDPRICVDFADATYELIGPHQNIVLKPNDGKLFNTATRRFEGDKYDLTQDFDALFRRKVRYIGGCCTVQFDTIKTYDEFNQKFFI